MSQDIEDMECGNYQELKEGKHQKVVENCQPACGAPVTRDREGGRKTFWGKGYKIKVESRSAVILYLECDAVSGTVKPS